MVSRIL